MFEVDQGWRDYPDEQGMATYRHGSGAMGAVFGGPARLGGGYANGYSAHIGQIDVTQMPPCHQSSSPEQIQADSLALQQAGYDAPYTTDACDAQFRAAVWEFQEDNQPEAGTVDGLIGPNTRAILARTVVIHGGDLPPPPLPDDVPPPVPDVPVPPVPVPPGPGPGPIHPASAKKSDNTLTYVAVGVGALALVGLGVWAFSK